MMRPVLTVFLATCAAAIGGCATADDSLEAAGQRAAMVAQIEENAREAQFATGIGQLDPQIHDALRNVPRHAFVPSELEPFAYMDTPLPLGHGQSISQPYLIALMVQLTDVKNGDRVFETGTGAGYVAAVLSSLGADVYTAEVVEPLARQAAEKLAALGYDGVAVKLGDGYFGWAEKGPYDVILVKEAVHHVPPPLLRQLKPGGRMVAPIGPLEGGQILTLITKDEAGTVKTRPVLPVRFTPLQGGERI